MQGFVLRRDDPSLEAMKTMTRYSRQALHKALRGPDLPSRDLVKIIVEALFKKRDDENEKENAEACRRAVRQALDALSDAIADKAARERTGDTWGSDTMPPPPVALTSVRELKVVPPGQVEQFASALRDAYDAGGRPSLVALTRRMGAFGQLPIPPAKSSVSDWLNGKSVPRDFEMVVLLVSALESAGAPRFPRRRWEMLWRAAMDERLARPRQVPQAH